jgi:hypothetical protein
MKNIITAAIALLALAGTAEARATGCSVGTIEACAHEEGAAQVLAAAITKYIATWGDPGGFRTDTRVYEQPNVAVVCGFTQDNVRFLWTWNDSQGETITHGKLAKTGWAMLCN